MEAIVYAAVAVAIAVAYHSSEEYRRWVDNLPE